MKRLIFCTAVLFIVVVRSKASTPNPLPAAINSIVTDPGLKKFEGSIENNKSKLSWSVNDNESLNLFEVERSFDGKEFKTIAIVFTAEEQGDAAYAFKETITKSPNAYYRLKIVEKDNSAHYSTVLLLKK